MKNFCCFHSDLSQKGQDKEQIFVLSREESHHLIKVLRANEGASVALFNSQGEFAEGHLREILKGNAVIVASKTRKFPVQLPEISLAVAVPKGKTMESIIKKATEIGVANIIPLQTSRTEVHIKSDRRENKENRWEQIAIEACKQSGNLRLPVIKGIQSFKDYINQLPQPAAQEEKRIIASLEADSVPLKRVMGSIDIKGARHVTFLTGPEGDFSPEEYAMARAAHFLPARLANHVLRVETAVMYALSALDYERQSL